MPCCVSHQTGGSIDGKCFIKYIGLFFKFIIRLFMLLHVCNLFSRFKWQLICSIIFFFLGLRSILIPFLLCCSMFVLLKGRSLKEAFKIGQEIALAITELNPNPVTLKMEKVYYPCFLLTKKRYVGYSYESPDQSNPIFDAKGIETVRRDTCAAVSKTMEQSLRIYFECQNIDEVGIRSMLSHLPSTTRLNFRK